MYFITVTSDKQNPFDFEVDFSNHIEFKGGYELALFKIHYKSVYNVTEENNKIYLENRQKDPVKYERLAVPPGYYRDAHTLLTAIHLVLKKYFDFYDLEEETDLSNKLIFKKAATSESVSLNLPGTCNFMIGVEQYGNSNIISSMLLKTMGGKYHKLLFENNWEFSSPYNVGLLYTTLVQNSIFNDRYSRILATIPINVDDGYTCYEPSNPIYHKLSVDSFINVRFQIRDCNGNIIPTVFEINAMKNQKEYYPTVITLGLRKV